jgi:HSP20 family protein
MPRRGRGDSSFHLVERGFGRFARAVRLSGAVDASRASASLVDGELRVSLPKIAERRGRAIHVAVSG